MFLTIVHSNEMSNRQMNNSTVIAGAVARRCSVKKVFLKILQSAQENTCVKMLNKKLQIPDDLNWLLLLKFCCSYFFIFLFLLAPPYDVFFLILEE